MDAITTQGMHMAKLGLGTWRMKGDECRDAIEQALSLGYRHIDTAEMYGNEEAVGAALARTSVPRDQIHVTSKVWWEHLAPPSMAAAVDGSLQKLGLDHLDLYLVHWPAPGMDVDVVMHELSKLQEAGKTKAIGVANFPSSLIQKAMAAGAKLACNQVEYHVLLSQDPLLRTLREAGIPLVAYAPLAQGRLAEHEPLRAIAAKHGVSPAQIALKWLLDQDGVAAIPKASRPESQSANLHALDITLDDADRAAIAALPKTERFVKPAFAPEWD